MNTCGTCKTTTGLYKPTLEKGLWENEKQLVKTNIFTAAFLSYLILWIPLSYFGFNTFADYTVYIALLLEFASYAVLNFNEAIFRFKRECDECKAIAYGHSIAAIGNLILLWVIFWLTTTYIFPEVTLLL